MIVPMAKVQVLGPMGLLKSVLELLQSRKVLELRSGPAPAADVPALLPIDELAQAELAGYRESERRIRDLLLLVPPRPQEGSAFLPEPGTAALARELGRLEDEWTALGARRAGLREEQEVLRRYEGVLAAFVSMQPSLPEVAEPRTFGMLVRRDRPEVVPLLMDELKKITADRFRMVTREIDRDRLAAVVVVPPEHAAAVSRLLFEGGVSEIRLPARYAGRPLAEAVREVLHRREALPRELGEVEGAISAFAARWSAPLARTRDEARDRADRLEAMGRVGGTGHAFVVYGWVPQGAVEALSRTLDVAFARKVALRVLPVDPGELARVPVLLANPGPLQPFELLLGLVSLPRYGDVDPTPFLALFYPLFFGAILGDVGHGAVVLLIALLARRRGWGGRLGVQVATIAMACAVGAILFGVLYGELFGDLGARLIGMRPILVDRQAEPLATLALAVGLGVVHILTGLGIAVWSEARHRRPRAAITKAIAATMLVLGAVAAAGLAGAVPDVAGRGSRIALLPLAAAAVLLEGPQALLELLRMAGNVLSYARLMALGVAGVMLAAVANRMPEYLPGVAGVVAALFLHLVNFAIGLFSPAIQALRLHYVEFFDKFFEGGGRGYRPFASSR